MATKQQLKALCKALNLFYEDYQDLAIKPSDSENLYEAHEPEVVSLSIQYYNSMSFQQGIEELENRIDLFNIDIESRKMRVEQAKKSLKALKIKVNKCDAT